MQTEQSGTHTVNIVRTLFRGRFFILWCILIALAIAVGIHSLGPKRFRVDTVISIGSFPLRDGTDAFLEHPSDVVEKITDGSYFDDVRSQLNLATIPAVGVKNPEGSGLVELWIDSTDPQSAQKILDAVNGRILSEQQTVFDRRTASTTDNLATIERALALLENKNLPLYTDTAISTLVIERSTQKDRLANAAPTTVIKNPAESEHSVNSSLIVTLALALFIGLLIGIAGVLGQAWWKRGTTA